jgi:hypothetical protein
MILEIIYIDLMFRFVDLDSIHLFEAKYEDELQDLI